jgi:hypothetical protein
MSFLFFKSKNGMSDSWWKLAKSVLSYYELVFVRLFIIYYSSYYFQRFCFQRHLHSNSRCTSNVRSHPNTHHTHWLHMMYTPDVSACISSQLCWNGKWGLALVDSCGTQYIMVEPYLFSVTQIRHHWHLSKFFPSWHSKASMWSCKEQGHLPPRVHK